ncbi:MAG: hypothetical protein HN806_03295 [Gammaproteobacteria bacterium]|jgi:hypothetical protein|nr:hypothetical protein [Gammaproteobacteria bacterium]MBT7327548.1 hypothetical protein [Gammaproteobacteria bacterium]
MFVKKTGVIMVVAFFLLGVGGCADKSRLGMMKDPVTGLQYGSIIGESFFIDPDQFPNKTIKVTARNVSGDINYDIREFVGALKSSFEEKGYFPYKSNGFGLKVDVIVEYSGHIQQNMSSTFGLLGGGAGYIAGRHSSAIAAEGIGIVAGATLGAIAGSYVTDDTYIIVAKVNIGVMDGKSGKNVKTITFSSSPKHQEEDESDGFKRFKEVVSTKVAVFGGGRNVSQDKIINEVKRRLIRVVSDVI